MKKPIDPSLPPFLLSKAKTSCSSPQKKSQQKLHSGQSFSFDGMPYKCNKSRKGQEEVIITICEKLYIHQGHSRKERMSLFKPYRVSKKTCTMFLIYFLVDLPQTKPWTIEKHKNVPSNLFWDILLTWKEIFHAHNCPPNIWIQIIKEIWWMCPSFCFTFDITFIYMLKYSDMGWCQLLLD